MTKKLFWCKWQIYSERSPRNNLFSRELFIKFNCWHVGIIILQLYFFRKKLPKSTLKLVQRRSKQKSSFFGTRQALTLVRFDEGREL